MKKTKIIYWIVTIIFGGFMLVTSIPDVIRQKEAVDFITHMGYPAYFVPFIGVAKVLGVIGILVPGYPRIKEWAYAGLVFDLVAAAYSFIALGYPPSGWAFMALPLAAAAISYAYYHKLKREAARAAATLR